MEKKQYLEIITLLCVFTLILAIFGVAIKSCKDTQTVTETYTLLPNNIISVHRGDGDNYIVYSDSINFPFKQYGECIIIRVDKEDIDNLFIMYKDYNRTHVCDSLANTYEICRTNTEMRLRHCSN